MPGRTLAKFLRVYYSGFDISGYFRNVNEFGGEQEEVDLSSATDAVKGALGGKQMISAGPINCVLDTTATTGLHAIASGANYTDKLLTIVIGDLAVPTGGEPCFNMDTQQKKYSAVEAGGAMVATIELLPSVRVTAISLQDNNPFGLALNVNTARTAPNASAGFDNPTAGQTLFGGEMFYHVLAGNGTATLSIDDSANNSVWAALAGATTGVIDCSVRSAGSVALARNATVRRYLRWQLALGTATTVTFVLSFNRNYN